MIGPKSETSRRRENNAANNPGGSRAGALVKSSHRLCLDLPKNAKDSRGPKVGLRPGPQAA